MMKHFCDVNCRNSRHKTIVSKLTALNDILFLNHFVFCSWQNTLYPLKDVISDLTTQCKFTASCV